MFRGAWVPQGNPRTSPVAREPAWLWTVGQPALLGGLTQEPSVGSARVAGEAAVAGGGEQAGERRSLRRCARRFSRQPERPWPYTLGVACTAPGRGRNVDGRQGVLSCLCGPPAKPFASVCPAPGLSRPLSILGVTPQRLAEPRKGPPTRRGQHCPCARPRASCTRPGMRVPCVQGRRSPQQRGRKVGRPGPDSGWTVLSFFIYLYFFDRQSGQ